MGKIPWRRAWQPTPVFLPRESHGQRSLVGYSPWGHKESDTTERVSTAQPHFTGENPRYRGTVLISTQLQQPCQAPSGCPGQVDPVTACSPGEAAEAQSGGARQVRSRALPVRPDGPCTPVAISFRSLAEPGAHPPLSYSHHLKLQVTGKACNLNSVVGEVGSHSLWRQRTSLVVRW